MKMEVIEVTPRQAKEWLDRGAAMSYFRTETGRKVMFFDIAKAIDTLHPRLRGKHIFEQLSALGLYGEFRRGTTPCGLPYSFTEYLGETLCSGSLPHEVEISSKQNIVAPTFG